MYRKKTRERETGDVELGWSREWVGERGNEEKQELH